MKLDKIKLVPLPIAGVILSIFGLGLFFKDISPESAEILEIIGISLMILLALKLVLFREESREDLESPIILGTFATLPMAMMILSVFIKDINYHLALGIWTAAVLFHIFIMVYFTKKHILNFKMELVYTNYFVVFIGIGMASITGTAFGFQNLVDGIFLFSFTSMIFLIILVTYRYLRVPIEDHPFKPLVCIYAAPFSLLLCAFIQTSYAGSIEILIALYILSIVFYIFGLINLIRYIRMPFFPTFAAFTFPFVISATATKQFSNICGINLEMFLTIQIIIAISIVAYVLIQYIHFIVTAPID